MGEIACRAVAFRLPLPSAQAFHPREALRPTCEVREALMNTMQAAVFHGIDDVRIEEVPKPKAGP
ncbi:MAG TPA: hypothetical protein VFZ36_05605, partial [Vicinamibacterales bacterium]